LNIGSLPGSARTGGVSPATRYAVILKLMAATTTEAGLTVQCQLDTHTYPAGRKVSDEDLASICLVPDAFHDIVQI